jgi:carboxy-cis,cis-muconate cyclase
MQIGSLLWRGAHLSRKKPITTRMLHHLMVGTWTPPGAIFTFEFDDEALTLKLIKRTPIPEDEPISWMTFDVSIYMLCRRSWLII